MVFGKPTTTESPTAPNPGASDTFPTPHRSSLAEPAWSVLPPLLLGLAVLFLGLYVPRELSDLLHGAAIALGAE
jgi:hypothetical protein